MKKTISIYDFRDAFQNLRPDNFTYDGLLVLFDYFEMLEDDCGIEIELDVIAFCCEYSEMTKQELIDNYGDDYFTEDMGKEEIEEILHHNTCFCGYSESEESFIFESF